MRLGFMLSRVSKIFKSVYWAGCRGSVLSLFFLFPALRPINVAAQNYTILIHELDIAERAEVSRLAPTPSYPSAMAAYQYIQSITPTLQDAGFLAASIDSIGVSDTRYDVYLFTGLKYKWARVGFDSIAQSVLNRGAISTVQWAGRPLRPRQIAGITEKLLRWAEDNGYPFAMAGINIHSLGKGDDLQGDFYMRLGPSIRLDSITITTGDAQLSRAYILRYLGLQEGMPYNESKLRPVSARISELSFIREARPWAVSFKPGTTRLTLDLQEKKANAANAIIGLQPNSVETGKFMLTVDAQLRLQNILAAGESINLSYQNLQYKSPRLKVDGVYPYLFDSPVGVDVDFDLFKKDTAFRRTSLQVGLRYALSATDYFRVFYQVRSNRLITVDTAYVRSRKALPEDVDVTAGGAGAEVLLNRTDYRLSPRRGWEANIKGSALRRSVRRSDAITGMRDAGGFSFASLYDTLTRQTYQYTLQAGVATYLSLSKKLVVKAAYTGGYISGSNLFRNELYQIGGFRVLRGFDEQSIFANQYHIATAELRLLFSGPSFVYLFSDNGWVESRFSGFSRTGFYNGFGLGATLETKSGLFTISYALGRSPDSPVQFRQSKVHFGYLALF
jgi:outer membrane protein assembly factor BamA